MIDIVIYLVFSIVLLFFMAYPAIKFVEFLSKRVNISKEMENFLVILFIIIFSLIVGAFLKYF